MQNGVDGTSSGSPNADAAHLSGRTPSDRRIAALQTGRAADLDLARAPIAILCNQQRLRTILRLALLADDHRVVEWHLQAAPGAARVAAVVVDLDSLGQTVLEIVELLGAQGVGNSVPLLFISIYPLDLRALQWVGPYDGLQPPFSPVVLIDRVRRLLRRVTPRMVAEAGVDRAPIDKDASSVPPGDLGVGLT